MNSTLQNVYIKGAEYLSRKQNEDGSWVGEVELNPGPTAQTVMLFAHLKKEFPAALRGKVHKYITHTQNEDGGWSTHFGATSDVSLTVECYVALRLLGISEESSTLEQARRCIAGLGGVNKTNTWTQLYLGVLGIRPWNLIQTIPVEIVLIPKWWPIQLEHLSYWVNVISVPMALLGSIGPGKPIEQANTIRTELNAAQGTNENTSSPLEIFISKIGLQFRTYFPDARKKAIQTAMTIIENFTETSGDFGGNSCTAMNVIMALNILSNGQDPRINTGLRQLMTYGHETETQWRLQTCQSHVWDTGFSLMALPSPINAQSPTPDEKIKSAIEWVRQRQILDVYGQWSSNVASLPGGWCFGNHHDHSPVTDCTAVSLLGLRKHGVTDLSDPTVKRGVDWLLAMQHEEGGWSAYQKYSRGKYLNKLFKFKDIPEALVDVPKVDVSSKVVEALAQWQSSDARILESLARARSFLLASRELDSRVRNLWKGNYGVNFIYGTSFAVNALKSIDGKVNDEWARSPREFFMRTQREDGGWGESAKSYANYDVAGYGTTSVVQTAWAIIGLAACCDSTPQCRSAIERGLNFIMRNQKSDGSWEESQFLGTVFAEVVYFRYSLYSSYFPLIAIEKAQAVLGQGDSAPVLPV